MASSCASRGAHDLPCQASKLSLCLVKQVDATATRSCAVAEAKLTVCLCQPCHALPCSAGNMVPDQALHPPAAAASRRRHRDRVCTLQARPAAAIYRRRRDAAAIPTAAAAAAARPASLAAAAARAPRCACCARRGSGVGVRVQARRRHAPRLCHACWPAGGMPEGVDQHRRVAASYSGDAAAVAAVCTVQ